MPHSRVSSITDLKAPLTALLVFFSCTYAQAQDSRQHLLASLYHYSGMHTQLYRVRDTVLEETAQSLNGCADDAAFPDIDKLVANSINTQALKADYVQRLGEQLSSAQINQIIKWTRSPVGLKVHQLEANSLTLDEASLNALISDYRLSGELTKDRALAINKMLVNTGAVYFVSALNTESSAIVVMTSLCKLDSESLSIAQKAVRSARGEEGLIRVFLKQDFLMPASVIYRELSDDELNQFIAFTESDSGQAYYKALVQSIRLVLSGRVASLEQRLEAMLPED